MLFAPSQDELSDEEIVEFCASRLSVPDNCPATLTFSWLASAPSTSLTGYAQRVCHGVPCYGQPSMAGGRPGPRMTSARSPYRPIEPTRWRKRLAQASDAGPLSGSTSPVFPHVPPRLPSPRLVGVEAAE